MVMQGVESFLLLLFNYTSSADTFMYKVGQLFMNDCGWRLIPGLWSVLLRLSSLFLLPQKYSQKSRVNQVLPFHKGKQNQK